MGCPFNICMIAPQIVQHHHHAPGHGQGEVFDTRPFDCSSEEPTIHSTPFAALHAVDGQRHLIGRSSLGTFPPLHFRAGVRAG